jgi:hypothetical protein
MPKAIQPTADKKSLRKAAKSSALEELGAACSGEDLNRA